ncbi:MAG: hypothetical protein V1790_18675 [Planctomycetota bacterium]
MRRENSTPMIRRLLIIVGGVTVILAGVCLLSHVRQFGYVGSWQSIGLRDGKLWYIWRVTPISDGEGFYVDDASAVNRAMYQISMGARWREKPVWPWLLGILAVVGYSLILPPIRRLWKRPAPRWLIGVLTAACVLFAALWTTSHLAAVTFDGSQVHFRLSEGAAWVLFDRHRNYASLPWGTGWNVYRANLPLVVDTGGYFTWRGGNITLSLPLGVLLVFFAVPTIVLARPDRRAWTGYCKRCAYDLTGNESGACPECGTPTGVGDKVLGPSRDQPLQD